MDWSDTGIILAVKAHGETSGIVDLLTREHGRHAGLVRGARSRSKRPVLQPGNCVQAHWRARLADHLGSYTIEADTLRAGSVMDDRAALAGLNSACALSILCLPEREVHPAVYQGLRVLVESFDNEDIWPALYVRWEAGLLADLGYGLDTEKCAVTGVTEDLTHISPRTGRAVCREEAAPYLDKLLALPGFLQGHGKIEAGDIQRGLELTGYFLERRVLWPTNRQLPEARTRLFDELGRLHRL
ncbi:MAG: DNA repair protein RecO [Maricaulis sp.]|jgi:DNA repair protein RecO (recombination protein O)|nr:DNA repair protein RecO [Maricaulis sp.]MDG2043950.1 DNA repair protein RecO [Maricaulis sp.]